MFFEDTTQSTSAFDPSKSGTGSFAQRAAKEAAAAVSPEKFIQGYKELENLATETSRKIFGQIGASSDYIQKTLSNSYRNTIEVGASLKENFEIYQAIGSSLQRNVYLTESQLSDLVTIQQTTSLTADEIGKMVTGFQDLGQGTDKAIETTQKLTKTARTYGLNVNTFLKSVGENIKLVNSYGFKDGVEGLGRMVARAQALRFNFGEVKGLAAELLSPEKAIELAASFQTLGGEIGALGDPFKLMYMAENDMEGLQNTIIDAAKSAVMFNEETGEFKITGVEMRRLREQAQALGMNYEDLANTAVKAAKEQRVMESLDFTGLNQDQKQLIANLSEIGTNGQIKLNVPGFENITDVSKLTADEFKKLKEYQDNANLSEGEIARQSLSVEKQQEIYLRKIASAGLLSGDYLSAGEGTKGEDLESLLRTVTRVTGDETAKTIEDFVTDSQYTDILTSFMTGSKDFVTDASTLFQGFVTDLSNTLKRLGGGSTSGNGLYYEDLSTTDPGPPINEFLESLKTLQVSASGVVNALNEAIVGGSVRAPTATNVDDAYVSAGGIDFISGPAGTFKLNPLDSTALLAGTDLFSNVNENSKNTNVNVGGAVKMDINVIGVNDEDMKRKFKQIVDSPEFKSEFRRIVSGTPALGDTTAGFVG